MNLDISPYRRCADDVTGAGSHIGDQLGISENLSFKSKIMSISNSDSILIMTDYCYTI